MQALILDDCPNRQTSLSVALMSRGFHVLNAQTNETGTAFARRGAIDLLVMAERVQGALTHCVALSAERQSPYVATIMLTPRRDDDLQELYELLPSLYSILGLDMSADLIGELGLAGVTGATCHTGSEKLLLMPGGNHLETGSKDNHPTLETASSSSPQESTPPPKWVFSSTHRPTASRVFEIAAQ